MQREEIWFRFSKIPDTAIKTDYLEMAVKPEEHYITIKWKGDILIIDLDKIKNEKAGKFV